MVEGTINYTQTSTNSGTSSIQDYLLGLGTFLVTVLIIWLLCLWIAPKFLDNTNKVLKNKFGPVVGLGILTPIILVISSIILILLGITSSIAILALGVFFLLIAISTSIFAITINNLICQKLKIDKKPIMFGTLIIVSTILWLIELVNYIGPVISIISTILGFGIITYYILFNKNIDKKKDKKD